MHCINLAIMNSNIAQENVYTHLQSPTITKMILGQFASATAAHWWRDLASVCRQWRDIIAEFAARPGLLSPAQLFYDESTMARHKWNSKPQYLLLAPQGFMPGCSQPTGKPLTHYPWVAHNEYTGNHVNILPNGQTGYYIIYVRTIDRNNKVTSLTRYLRIDEPAEVIPLPKPINWQCDKRTIINNLISRLPTKLTVYQRWYLGYMYIFNGDLEAARMMVPFTRCSMAIHNTSIRVEMGCAEYLVNMGATNPVRSDAVQARINELRMLHDTIHSYDILPAASTYSQTILFHLYCYAVYISRPGAAADIIAAMRLHAFNLALNYTISCPFYNHQRIEFIYLFVEANKVWPRYDPGGDCDDEARTMALITLGFGNTIADMKSVPAEERLDWADGITAISKDATWLGSGLHDPSTCRYCPAIK